MRGPVQLNRRLVVIATAVVTLSLGCVGQASAAGVPTPAVKYPATTDPSPSAPAPAEPAGSVPQKAIVVMQDQLAGTPADADHAAARAAAAKGSQDAVLQALPGGAPADVQHFTVGNAFTAILTPEQATALAADPAVASVTADQLVPVAPTTSTGVEPAAAAEAAPAAAPASVPSAACSTDPAKPQLEPEALSTINARSDDPAAKTSAALGIDGSGVKVAYIADGVNPANPGLLRPDGSSAVIDYQDFYGDGPSAVTSGAEAFGDASAIAAQGTVTYDVADFANPAVVAFPGGHCYIRIVGVAPGAGVVALKAGSELLPNSAILQAIDYAVTVAHVDVLNESFGGNIYPDSGARNTIEVFDDQAVKAGVTVTVSTGDAGITGTIGNPSTDPNVISTGASTDSRIYEQTGYALATKFSATADPAVQRPWLDDNISSLSSAGITQNGRAIDLSAPGEADWAICDDSGRFTGCTNFHGGKSSIQSFGGTSQSAPITAGVAALVIQAYRRTHNGASPTPALVKRLLTSTSRDLGLPGDEQGTGRLDARAAVEAALTYPGATAPTPDASSNIAVSTDQLTLEGAPGSTQTGRVTVQNVGSSPLAVLPSTRRFARLGTPGQQTVQLSTDSAQTTPYPVTGAPWVYKTTTFTVPAGTDRLTSTIAWASGAGVGQAGPVVRLSLFAPNGSYAANTRPQGGPRPANYGSVDVAKPAAGTWTAVLYTPQTGGFSGPVTLSTTNERAIPVGTISPSPLTLKPGQKKTISMSFQTPAVGGDDVDTVSLGSSNGHQTAIPVIMRAVVPTRSGSGQFAGTITGGNARGGAPAQTFSYAFDVPRGKKDLDVSVTLANDPGDLIEGILVDPRGETPSVTSNVSPDTHTQGLSLSNTVATPIPGRWRYVVVVLNPVSGTEISQDFHGVVAFNTQSVTQPGPSQALPTRPGTVLAADQPRQFAISVHNPGPAAVAVQTDARTTDLSQVQLAPQFAGSTFALPVNVDDLSAIPAYLVPPDTTSLALSASSTVPAQVELFSPAFGIDLFGDLKQAQGGSTISTATVKEKTPAEVGQGYWTTYVQEIGPFTDAGAPTGSTTLVANARTAGFDRAVQSSTGDPYLAAIDTTAPHGRPVIIAPNGSADIAITITPGADIGTVVMGELHVVTTPGSSTTPSVYPTGDILATLPYTYTVGPGPGPVKPSQQSSASVGPAAAVAAQTEQNRGN